MFSEDDLIPISALQHIMFCPRQYALIHLEQLWEENQFTMEGNILHERVDVEHHENRRCFRQEFAMPLRSLVVGLVGKSDLVEIFFDEEHNPRKVIPVEFKRGSNKEDDFDRIQLCAQALCLEEMMGIPVPIGQFYYLKEHRRTSVEIDSALREKTNAASESIRAIQKEGQTPPAEYSQRKCPSCSLFDLCLPKSAGSGKKRVERYIQNQLSASRAECLP